MKRVTDACMLIADTKYTFNDSLLQVSVMSVTNKRILNAATKWTFIKLSPGRYPYSEIIRLDIL